MQNVNQKCEYEYEYRERASEWVSECSFFCCCFFCLLFFLFYFFYLMRFCDDVCSMRRWISNCNAGNAGRSTDADGARADCTQREKERKETRRKGEREILRQQRQHESNERQNCCCCYCVLQYWLPAARRPRQPSPGPAPAPATPATLQLFSLPCSHSPRFFAVALRLCASQKRMRNASPTKYTHTHTQILGHSHTLSCVS